MATGSVIENLSTRKLLIVLAAFAGLLCTFIYIGAHYTPEPSSAMEFLMTKCADQTAGRSKEWFYIRPMVCLYKLLTFLSQNCKVIPKLEEHQLLSTDVRDIVFVAQMPHARDGIQLEYSPWFQFLLGLLEVEVAYDPSYSLAETAHLQLEVRLGYRKHDDRESDWHVLVESTVDRKLDCRRVEKGKKASGYAYECSTIDLFELGSNKYPLYLLNIRIPVNQSLCRIDPKGPNCAIGMIDDLRVIAIHQNGGFTTIWVWLKTLMWPVVVAATCWFHRRLQRMKRVSSLTENSILVLGITLFPLEWLTLWTQASFFLLLGDIRQGLFYTVLLSFWLVFTGEHLITETDRNSLVHYWKNLSVVGGASICLLVYDVFERGLQLFDPFHSVWATEFGSNVALASIYIAIVLGAIYFGFLGYKISLAWVALRNERARLYRQKERINQLKVQGVMYRFKFLFIFTLICAALTTCSYVMKQYGESQLHGDDYNESWIIASTSVFFTGTFGLWNIYVLLLLVMYAPSQKYYANTQTLNDENDDLIDGPVESNPLSTFIKPSQD